MPVTRHPPHRSQRAELPHWAPALGINAQTLPAVSVPTHVAGLSGAVSGTWLVGPDSPWPVPFPPLPPQAVAHHRLCSEASQVLRDCLTSPTFVHRCRAPLGFTARTSLTLGKAKRGTSRFPRKELTYVLGVFDHAGSDRISR